MARKVVEMGLALRAETGIKVKQPLAKLQVTGYKLKNELKQIIADELNIKEVSEKEASGDGWVTKEDGNLKVSLNTEITAELKLEGLARGVIRAINQIRKESKLTISDTVVVEYQTDDAELTKVMKDFASEIKKSVLAKELKFGSVTSGSEVEIDGRKILLLVSK